MELELTDACEPASGCWRSKLGPLQEEYVLLTPEPSLQTSCENFEIAESRLELGPYLVASDWQALLSISLVQGSSWGC